MTLLWYEMPEPRTQAEMERCYEQLRTELGDKAIGVCGPDGRLWAVAPWANTAGRAALERRHADILPQLTCGNGAAAPSAVSPVAMAGRRVPRKRLFGRIREFVAAVTGPECSDEEYRRRLMICESNECGFLKADGGKLYCGACGCPKWRLAELRSKLKYARVSCPLEPPLWGSAANE